MRRANEILKNSVGVFRRGGGRPPTSVIVDAHRDRFGVDPFCTVLTDHDVPIAPSTYYGAKARGLVSDTAPAQGSTPRTPCTGSRWPTGVCTLSARCGTR